MSKSSEEIRLVSGSDVATATAELAATATAAISSEGHRTSANAESVKGPVEWVSSVSRWPDRRWVFDGRAVGSGTSTVTCIWDFKLHDGSTLFDEDHSQLLHEARNFFWSLYNDRRDGRRLKESAAGTVFPGLRRLLKWMVEHNYASFGELNNRASTRFCDWLVDYYANLSSDAAQELKRATANAASDGQEVAVDDECVGNHDTVNESEDESTGSGQILHGDEYEEIDPEDVGGITPGTMSFSLSTWRYLWEQRFALTRLGLPAMHEQPFSGRATHTVSAELATKLASRIPALPDEVAIPLLNEAHNFIATASSDLIKIMESIYQIHGATREDEGQTLSENPLVQAFLLSFKFSTSLGDSYPWREYLGAGGKSAFEDLRRLLDDLVDACTIIAQAETGMRIGEISSLLAGVNSDTGLPSCIAVRPSKSGMLDLYYLKSKLKKLRPTPVDEEWLLAAAPRGTKELPDAVQAIVVLQKVLAPLRALAEPDVRPYLIVGIGVPRGLPSFPSSVSKPSNHLLRLGQKNFAMWYVDWSEIVLTETTRPYIDSYGDCIRTHQWRKTYAQYVFQVDKRMLPAIARQFKHLSLAMTEGAYVGTSASLIAGVADFNRNLTAELFLSNIRGKAFKQEGRLAKLMNNYRPELEKIVEGMNNTEAYTAIDAWCRNRDMKIFFHGYGKCIPAIAPTKAECHKRAQTIHWANKAPNFSMREPSICTGCYLFLADEESIEHWTKRFVENMTAWLQADAQGRGNEYRVARTRAEQAKGYLQNLGAPLPSLDTVMHSTMEVAHAR
ncbi:hypothetical protein [Massilia phyllosphaerae]|uniref:hypothetical protein n=1 Tax=Massilia phyllosphaerae TaxID=3106034 RepID=UPI002B1CDD17|nr:hypothetical protein [Massilia sp. SGZ-792]